MMMMMDEDDYHHNQVQTRVLVFTIYYYKGKVITWKFSFSLNNQNFIERKFSDEKRILIDNESILIMESEVTMMMMSKVKVIIERKEKKKILPLILTGK